MLTTPRVAQAEVDAAPKSQGRSVYTRRILEIVKTWRKQKVNHDFNEYSLANCLYLLIYLLFQVEIDKILRDVREIQKDYNAATETLGRSFAAADEAVYRATSSDPHAKARLNLLVTYLANLLVSTGVLP